MNIFGHTGFGNIKNEATSKTDSRGDMYISPSQKKMFMLKLLQMSNFY